MTQSADAQSLSTEPSIPTVSLKAPIATDAILDTITDEPRLERINRYMYVVGIISTVLLCATSLGLYFTSR